MPRRRLIVGLTGALGSGKSTVAKLFRRWGAHVIDADRLAHAALRKDSLTYRRITKTFGPAILKANGPIDRKQLADVVFNDARKRKLLERIVHPFVFRKIGSEIRTSRRKIVVVEIPLLFETGFERFVHRTVVVDAFPEALARRLKTKRGYSSGQIRARIRAQWPMAKKKERSDFVINNNDGISKTVRQARMVWDQLTKEVR